MKRWIIFHSIVFSLCPSISSIRGKCEKIAKVETLYDRLLRVFEFQVLEISGVKETCTASRGLTLTRPNAF